MTDQTYKFEAFISYRHNDRDLRIASAISKYSEGYVIPTKRLRESIGKKKTGKLFRDEDELPFGGELNHAIVSAIRGSRKFIMLLNQDYLDEGHWCVYELAEFLRSHSYRDVIVVLTDGDISRLTRQAAAIMAKHGLNFYNEVDPSGKPVDPFIVDLSMFKTAKEEKATIKDKRLKIIAGILGVDYDTLNRREHKRQVRKRWLIFSPITAVILIVAVIVSLLALQINEQRIIAQKNELELLKETSINAVSAGDRLSGMRYALDAVDIYNQLYPDGHIESLLKLHQTLENTVYSQGFQLLSPIKSNNRSCTDVQFSPDDRYILAGLGGYSAALIDAYSGEILSSITRSRPYQDNTLTHFEFSSSGDYFLTVFGSSSGEIVIWETADNPKELSSHDVDENFLSAMFVSENEVVYGRLPIFTNDTLEVWNFITNKVRDSSAEEARRINDKFYGFLTDSTGTGTNTAKKDEYTFAQSLDGEQYLAVFEKGTTNAVAHIDDVTLMLGISHDGNRVVLGNPNGFCGIYNTPKSSTVTIVDSFSEVVYQYPSYFESKRDNPLMFSTFHYYDPQQYPFGQQYLLNEPTDRFFAMIYPDSFIEIWDLEKNEDYATYTMKEHSGIITKAFMTRNFLITTGQDGRLMIFNLREGILQNSIAIEDGVVSANLDPSGTKAIVVPRSIKSAYVIDLNTGFQLYKLEAEPNCTIDYEAIGFSENGLKSIARQSDGRTIVGNLYKSTSDLIRIAEKEVHYNQNQSSPDN